MRKNIQTENDKTKILIWVLSLNNYVIPVTFFSKKIKQYLYFIALRSTFMNRICHVNDIWQSRMSDALVEGKEVLSLFSTSDTCRQMPSWYPGVLDLVLRGG